MTPLDATVGILLVVLCGHVGMLLVTLVRLGLPQRRTGARSLALAAAGSALVGELLALGSLLGRPAPLAWVAGLLLVALALGLSARASWRQDLTGRAAFQATLAAPLVIVFVLTLGLR